MNQCYVHGDFAEGSSNRWCPGKAVVTPSCPLIHTFPPPLSRARLISSGEKEEGKGWWPCVSWPTQQSDSPWVTVNGTHFPQVAD